jgi:hypothetical protein
MSSNNCSLLRLPSSVPVTVLVLQFTQWFLQPLVVSLIDFYIDDIYIYVLIYIYIYTPPYVIKIFVIIDILVILCV